MKRVEKIAEAFNEIIDAQIDYEENHKDAGDSYRHLPFEGGWDYNNNDELLANFIRENEINDKGLDAETLADLVLNNFSMLSMHQFETIKKNIFYIDTYPINAIELQYGLLDICENLSNDLLLNVTPKRLIKIISNERADYYVRGMNIKNKEFYVYYSSDKCWAPIIDAKKLQKLIDDHAFYAAK